MSATITNSNEGDALQFPWGAIKWLCNDQIDPEAEMTFGVVYLNAGEGNPLHYHPNCEELIYVLSGQCDHRLGDEVYSLKAGDMLRIPQSVKHNAANTGWQPVTMVICYSAGDRQTVFCEEGEE
jgi:quercetin dioxygenase-like cupin family protein